MALYEVKPSAKELADDWRMTSGDPPIRQSATPYRVADDWR